MPSGIIYGAISVLSMILGFMGKHALAAWLRDPDTVQNISLLIASGTALAAGIAQGWQNKQPKQLRAAKYPGWVFDSVEGWIPDPNYKEQ